MFQLPRDIKVTSKRVVRIGGEIVPGLTNTIKRYLAPGYNHKKLASPPKNVGGLSMRQAKNRGNKIDSCITKWAESYPKQSTSRLAETRALIAYFDANGLVPVATQVIAVNRDAKVGTRVDLVVHDTGSNVCKLVEIKTGCVYRDTAMRNAKKMMHQTIGKDVQMTARRIHEIQTLMSLVMLQETYPNVPIDDTPILIYVSADGEIDTTPITLKNPSRELWQHVKNKEASRKIGQETRRKRKRSTKKKKATKKATKKKHRTKNTALMHHRAVGSTLDRRPPVDNHIQKVMT